MLGGFPCQPFSYAGKRKGFGDTRGTLFFEIERILQKYQPKAFLLENVRGLYTHDEGRTFDTIMSKLHDLGYSEIHTIVAIQELEEANVTAIAEKMHMTKGAISKIIKRLSSLGAIETYQ